MIAKREIFKKGRFIARPKDVVRTGEIKIGTQPLKLDHARDALMYVPKGYRHDHAASLAVMLHGAGGVAEHGMNLLRQYADDKNILLLSPASRFSSWDIIVKNAFSSDVIFIDQALSLVFERFNINTARIAIGGFSDGASYALCLGLSNGGLFTHIIAFSPGFYHTVENAGKPNIYISHGVKDHILPIGSCSRRIVPRLKSLGYHLCYEEFDGEHEIPAAMSTNAVTFFTGSK